MVNIKLPQDFTDEIRALLGDEADELIASFEKSEEGSMRINPLKEGADSVVLSKWGDMLTGDVPWEKYGHYYNDDIKPGRHPLHNAGAYYIQEASAMAPVFFLDVKPGERVLDLCAAPGGKSTQIAGYLKGEGLLVCNEPVPKRARILAENIERLSVHNAVVTSEDPSRLEDRFEEYFDKILVDAPCSGEGMFRKHPEAIDEWSLENVDLCAQRQADILDSAARMLKSGGRLVFSTCTFAKKEDEDSVSAFLERHPEFRLDEELYKDEAASFNMISLMPGTYRLFPHKLRGEGHFLAVFKKEGTQLSRPYESAVSKQASQFFEYAGEFLSDEGIRRIEKIMSDNRMIDMFKGQLCMLPAGIRPGDLAGLKISRAGLELGRVEKGRFEPSHALAIMLTPGDVKRSLDMNESDAQNYLKGLTIVNEDTKVKGWTLMCHENLSLGWSKCVTGICKNHYPKGLRVMQ